MNSLLESQWSRSQQHLKKLIMQSRKVTICLDGWSKKNLTSSFLGTSACFYDVEGKTARHAVLGIAQLEHPHTGEAIAEALATCLEEWSVDTEKVLLVVTDNGANMIKAIRLMSEMSGEGDSEDVNEGDDEAGEADTEVSNESELDLPPSVAYRRMQCMAHTLQLTIKIVYKHFDTLLTKARSLVARVRKSSKLMERIMNDTGKSVVTDNATRWNSTYIMIRRLLEIKGPLNNALIELGVDSLMVSEWTRLEDVRRLLEPFATQTDLLQTDALSLSYAVPAILDLQCHLQQFESYKVLTTALLADIQQRFSTVLDPSAVNFNPVPAAACLLDPSVASVLMSAEVKPLFDAAKMFISNEVTRHS